MSQRDGSGSEGACHQAVWPEFNPWELHGGKKALTPKSYLLTPILSMTHVCPLPNIKEVVSRKKFSSCKSDYRSRAYTVILAHGAGWVSQEKQP